MSAAEPVPQRLDEPAPVPGSAARFDGWRVVGVMFAAQALTVGVTGYAYSLFLKPIGEEFGVDPARLGLGQSGLMFAMMLVGPLLGVALDRYSIRALVIAGAATFAAGLALLAVASSLVWMAGAYCLIIGVGSLLAGPVSANKLVVSWFMRMRGRALGISSVGTSAGGVLLPVLCAWSIAELGWRGALVLLAGIALVALVPAAWWSIANRPEDRGQLPDGDPQLLAPVAAVEEHRVPLLTLVREPSYWGIALAFGLAWGVITSLFSFFHFYMDQLGIDAGDSALLMALFSGVAVAGKLVFGAAAERVDPRRLVLLGIALQFVYTALLRSEPGYGLLLVGSVVFGVSLGGLLPMHGLLVARYYGRTSFASVMGAMGPVLTPLMFLTIALGSWLPGVTGGYHRLFEVFLVMQVLAALSLFLLRPIRST